MAKNKKQIPSTRKVIGAILVGVIILLSAIWIVAVKQLEKRNVEYSLDFQETLLINDVRVKVAVADTQEKRHRGLSKTEPLDANEGMLFIFPEDDTYGIWMKDMNYSIDILWLDNNRFIIDTKENASPESYPEVFYPQTSSRYVIEVPAGFVRRHGIAIGDRVDF